MAKYDNQNQPFIYDRATGEKIPVSKEVRDAYYGEAAAPNEGAGSWTLRLPSEQGLGL